MAISVRGRGRPPDRFGHNRTAPAAPVCVAYLGSRELDDISAARHPAPDQVRVIAVRSITRTWPEIAGLIAEGWQ